MDKVLSTPVGEAGFMTVTEARGFQGAEENKKYGAELILDMKEGTKLAEKLQALANKLHVEEMEKLKSRGKPHRLSPPMINYRELSDGRLKFSFNRPEREGKPKVVDINKEAFEGFVRSGNKIKIAFTVRPYVLATAFGVSLRVEAIQVVERGGGSKTSTSAALEAFGSEASATSDSVKDLF